MEKILEELWIPLLTMLVLTAIGIVALLATQHVAGDDEEEEELLDRASARVPVAASVAAPSPSSAAASPRPVPERDPMPAWAAEENETVRAPQAGLRQPPNGPPSPAPPRPAAPPVFPMDRNRFFEPTEPIAAGLGDPAPLERDSQRSSGAPTPPPPSAPPDRNRFFEPTEVLEVSPAADEPPTVVPVPRPMPPPPVPPPFPSVATPTGAPAVQPDEATTEALSGDRSISAKPTRPIPAQNGAPPRGFNEAETRPSLEGSRPAPLPTAAAPAAPPSGDLPGVTTTRVGANVVVHVPAQPAQHGITVLPQRLEVIYGNFSPTDPKEISLYLCDRLQDPCHVLFSSAPGTSMWHVQLNHFSVFPDLHADIQYQNGRFLLTNKVRRGQEERFQTRVNGAVLMEGESRALTPGDIISLGIYRLRFS